LLHSRQVDGLFPFSEVIGREGHSLWIAFTPTEGFTIGYPADF
jgi:hypothetical protein